MSSTQSTYSDAYLNILTSNGAFLLIQNPKRATNTSSSIIDHIVTNDKNNILRPYIVISGGLTDHFTVACLVTFYSRNHNVNRSSEQPIFIRDKRRFQRDLFSADLNASLCELLRLKPLNSSESNNTVLLNVLILSLLALIGMLL